MSYSLLATSYLRELQTLSQNASAHTTETNGHTSADDTQHPFSKPEDQSIWFHTLPED